MLDRRVGRRAGVGERLKVLPGEQSSALVSHVTPIMSPVDKLNTRESKVSVSYKPISSTEGDLQPAEKLGGRSLPPPLSRVVWTLE